MSHIERKVRENLPAPASRPRLEEEKIQYHFVIDSSGTLQVAPDLVKPQRFDDPSLDRDL